MSEEERKDMFNWPIDYKGKVMTCSGKDIFKSGALRHPNFVRLHPDKDPKDCIRTRQCFKG
jgi:ATP-dependent DNA ligase